MRQAENPATAQRRRLRLALPDDFAHRPNEKFD